MTNKFKTHCFIMAKFKKGNNSRFKSGNIPHNKKRTKVKEAKSDSYQALYTRLTKKKHELVVNDPYSTPEEKSKRACRAAKLLRPKAKVSYKPKYRKISTKHKR